MGCGCSEAINDGRRERHSWSGGETRRLRPLARLTWRRGVPSLALAAAPAQLQPLGRGVSPRGISRHPPATTPRAPWRLALQPCASPSGARVPGPFHRSHALARIALYLARSLRHARGFAASIQKSVSSVFIWFRGPGQAVGGLGFVVLLVWTSTSAPTPFRTSQWE